MLTPGVVPEEVTLAVKKGAAWLDQVYPEWIGLIDLGKLAMLQSESCILGQAAGDFNSVEAWLYGGMASTHVDALMEEMGFTIHSWDPEAWHELDAAWTAYILEHRS